MTPPTGVALAQTMATGVTNTSTFTYNSGNTVITDQQGQTTTMTYSNNQLTQITLPPAQSGATAQTLSFTYNGNGDVADQDRCSGNVTTTPMTATQCHAGARPGRQHRHPHL